MISNSETTSFSTTKKIGTVGTIGQGVTARVLETIDENGELSRRWFTWSQIKRLGLDKVPAGEVLVRVESRVLAI